jgi:ABC-2 type transport system ATP-binding protein
VLAASKLSKRYGSFVALKGLDLRVEPGEVYCLLGANGAGKTTTIQLFLGFIAPSSGTAEIAGKDVQREPIETKRLTSYVPENVMLYPNLSGLENLAFFATLAGKGDVGDQRLRDCLERVGLQREAADRRVGTYSKGYASEGRHRARDREGGASALASTSPRAGSTPRPPTSSPSSCSE